MCKRNVEAKLRYKERNRIVFSVLFLFAAGRCFVRFGSGHTRNSETNMQHTRTHTHTHTRAHTLYVSFGTGLDKLPTRILKSLHGELALPVTLLARKLLVDGCWPRCWRLHWVHGMHKTNSTLDGRNYRGVHLTAQLSKVIERAVGEICVPLAERSGCFGLRQFAYAKGRSYKDVLALDVCSWLSRMNRGFLVGLYCSDVSGAFDRVTKARMCAKLQASGFHKDVVAFLSSWLDDRISKVVVGGEVAPDMPLNDGSKPFCPPRKEIKAKPGF